MDTNELHEKIYQCQHSFYDRYGLKPNTVIIGSDLIDLIKKDKTVKVKKEELNRVTLFGM